MPVAAKGTVDRRVRDWMDDHPRTCLWTAFCVTVQLGIQIVQAIT